MKNLSLSMMLAFVLAFIQTFPAQAEDFREAYIPAIALYPQQNAIRNRLDLSGIWNFQLDPNDEGEGSGWFNGLPDPQSIAVPGSWNDQLDQQHNYLGTAWYETETYVPSAWKDGNCPHFAKIEKVQFAWGFNGLYRNLPHNRVSEVRKALRHFMGSGVSAYYRVHHGEKLLSPARQQEILDFIAQFCSTEGLSFDHYITQYDFLT